MLDWQEIAQVLERHDIRLDRPLASSYEGLVIGNADMGATIFGPPENLTFRLGKMDLWDARWNAEHYIHPMPLSQLKEYIYAQSQGLAPQQIIPMELNDSWQGHGRVYPCMRTGADLIVRVAQGVPGYPLTLDQRLHLADGTWQGEFALGWWRPFPRITCQALVSWEYNVLALRFQMEKPYLGRNLVIGLWRDPWGARDWGLLSSMGSLRQQTGDINGRDPREDALPPAEISLSGHTASLWQTIPGDEYAPERGFTVVAFCPKAEFLLEPSGQAILEAQGQEQLDLFVSMASEFEAPESRQRAMRLAQQAANEGYDTLYANHAAAWQAYWSQAMVELEDRALEREWAHSIYAMGINSRAGRPATPLFGVSTIMDCPPWKGDRHNNWPEFSNRFWGAFTGNREEQALNYSEFVHSYLPTARRIAREVFEVEDGAVYPHCYIDGTSQYYFHHVWGYNLYVTAVHAQNCWWHYEYFGNREALERLGYPVMRDCANFYTALVAKNPPGNYDLWPTITCEIRGWTRNFELNKNNVEDLAYLKFLLRSVIAASELLDVDADARARWRDLLEHLAPYPTLFVNGVEEFVDFANLSERPNYNCSVPLAPMWPGEDLDVWRDPRLHQIARNTTLVEGWQDGPREAMCMMRLGMRERLWERLPMYLSQISPWYALKLAHHGTWSVMVNEMLLTSWDGIIRLFPAWPQEKEARFRDLRAKGAFLVSASCAHGDIQQVTIRSERGNPVAIQAPWHDTIITDINTGQVIACSLEKGILRWPTTPGQEFRLCKASI